MAEPDRRGSRVWWLAIPGLVLAWCVYLVTLGPGSGGGGLLSAPDLKPAASVAPSDLGWELSDLDGRPLRLEQLRGRPIFLNLWATWCGPCMIELPSIRQLAANPRLKDVAFLCVSVEDDPAGVAPVAREQRLDGLTVLLSRGTPPLAFQTQALPTTYLIDRAGRIVVEESGAAQWDDPSVVDRLEAMVKAR